MGLGPQDQALVRLLLRLGEIGYDFVTPTPLTHRRVARRRAEARPGNLRDIFGWNLPFDLSHLPPKLGLLLEEANALEPCMPLVRSRFRVSRVGLDLFIHSAFPTDRPDAVFLGPDSYRFVRFLEAELPICADRLIDMGTGAGVGAICAARKLAGAALVLVDANPEALRLARINAQVAGLTVHAIAADRLDAVSGEIQLLVANPPFIMDRKGLTYRDGGDMLGAALSRDWALAAAERLRPGGRVLLYTGSAIVDGRDALREALEAGLAPLGCTMRYDEIDPDIFGEQLSSEGYEQVERIAAVGAVITRVPILSP